MSFIKQEKENETLQPRSYKELQPGTNPVQKKGRRHNQTRQRPQAYLETDTRTGKIPTMSLTKKAAKEPRT
jgi:hypothetical protein